MNQGKGVSDARGGQGCWFRGRGPGRSDVIVLRAKGRFCCNSRAGRETLRAKGEVFRRKLLENRLHNGNRVAV
ncbi:unnamed protein product [Caretta caretta]